MLDTIFATTLYLSPHLHWAPFRSPNYLSTLPMPLTFSMKSSLLWEPRLRVCLEPRYSAHHILVSTCWGQNLECGPKVKYFTFKYYQTGTQSERWTMNIILKIITKFLPPKQTCIYQKRETRNKYFRNQMQVDLLVVGEKKCMKTMRNFTYEWSELIKNTGDCSIWIIILKIKTIKFEILYVHNYVYLCIGYWNH